MLSHVVHGSLHGTNHDKYVHSSAYRQFDHIKLSVFNNRAALKQKCPNSEFSKFFQTLRC